MRDPRLDKLQEIDGILSEKGWPKISPWWWNVIEDFYASGVIECVIEGGRRGGKSSTICKIACAELLTDVVDDKGELRPFHHVPQGDIGYFGMISAERDQAKARVATVKSALHALGAEMSKEATEEIILGGRRLGVKAITASLSGVVSFTCIGALLDEMALWGDDTAANPAPEVVRSLKPTTLTMKRAKLWYVSAPWSESGLHYEMTQEGNTNTQRVFHGASWEMNPTITKEETRLLEKDYQAWLRAYAAIPVKTDETRFFSSAFIDACCGKVVRVNSRDAQEFGITESTLQFAPITGMVDRIAGGADFAFKRNSSAVIAIAGIKERMRLIGGDERVPGAMPLRPTATIRELVTLAASLGADSVAADIHYIESVREVMDEISLPLLSFPSKTEEIEGVYLRARVLASEGALDLRAAPPKLITQLRETTQKPTQHGLGIRNPTKAGAHGDWVSAMICAVWGLDQPAPDRFRSGGGRRFGRGGNEAPPDGVGKLTDLPRPEDLD